MMIPTQRASKHLQENYRKIFPNLKKLMLINKQTNKHHLKNFNPEMFLSKEQTGIKNGSVAEGRTMWRLPFPPISIPSSDTKPHTVAGAKRHLLSGTWYDCSYGGSTSK
jgi:hypothetical protein